MFGSAHYARRLLLLQVDPLYAGIFISSMGFPALASIFKEKIFAGGGPHDICILRKAGSKRSSWCPVKRLTCLYRKLIWALLQLAWILLCDGDCCRGPSDDPKHAE